MEYYGKSAAVISSDAVQNRMERISQRLSLMAAADRYAGEGSALEREGNISELLGFTAARGWVEAQVGTDDLVLYSSRICVYKSWRRVDLSKADEVGIYTGQLKEVLFFLSVRRHDIWTP